MSIHLLKYQSTSVQDIKYHKFITNLQPKIISSQVINQVNQQIIIISSKQNYNWSQTSRIKMKLKIVQ